MHSVTVSLKENIKLRNGISFRKDTEKTVLLQVKLLIEIIVKFRAEKNLCTFVSCTKHPFEVHKTWPTKSNLVHSAYFCCKKKAKKTPWNTSNK